MAKQRVIFEADSQTMDRLEYLQGFGYGAKNRADVIREAIRRMHEAERLTESLANGDNKKRPA